MDGFHCHLLDTFLVIVLLALGDAFNGSSWFFANTANFCIRNYDVRWSDWHLRHRYRGLLVIRRVKVAHWGRKLVLLVYRGGLWTHFSVKALSVTRSSWIWKMRPLRRIVSSLEVRRRIIPWCRIPTHAWLTSIHAWVVGRSGLHCVSLTVSSLVRAGCWV